jgi:hypothetical protein
LFDSHGSTKIATASLNPDPENTDQPNMLVIFPTPSNANTAGLLLATIMPQRAMVAFNQLLARQNATQQQVASGVNPIPVAGLSQQQQIALQTLLQQRQGQGQGQGQGERF